MKPGSSRRVSCSVIKTLLSHVNGCVCVILSPFWDPVTRLKFSLSGPSPSWAPPSDPAFGTKGCCTQGTLDIDSACLDPPLSTFGAPPQVVSPPSVDCALWSHEDTEAQRPKEMLRGQVTSLQSHIWVKACQAPKPGSSVQKCRYPWPRPD